MIAIMGTAIRSPSFALLVAPLLLFSLVPLIWGAPPTPEIMPPFAFAELLFAVLLNILVPGAAPVLLLVLRLFWIQNPLTIEKSLKQMLQLCSFVH